jgi:hypothetical protein
VKPRTLHHIVTPLALLISFIWLAAIIMDGLPASDPRSPAIKGEP